ncbi:MAG TPA: DUF5996 family protein [Terriglobia bacterium]|nr:DUF5996 family protein [Terriglobia bacterium]
MISPEWPPLAFPEWESTCDTLHLWTQIVGKTRLTLTPIENHWWNVTLYVTPRGLTTRAIPFGRVTFEVQFDLLAHRLILQTSEGIEYQMPLYPRSVADFYREYMAGLRALGIDVQIHATPDEFDDKTPFSQDEHHAAYDRAHVESFRRILINCDRALKEFRSRFIGKCSPVHFFWGSFDLAVTRFSGRRASLPPDADLLTREGYSHECVSCGFWPGDRRYPQAAFYSYTAPMPAGLDAQPVHPAAAHWNPKLGEFILNYDDVRAAASPAQAILDFCQSTYEAGAKLAGWDRKELERESHA